ncbi:hypothetical protein llap_12436 [Limosa lapponica baueri]|uniref:Uncharacterized protein n=1 Tax=Limosa lapponica baueri TaxID=1758121 RepID=A0A2I0TTZ7_LIMLA|nr:hypothetical protein llap_12436 [Limosa lapponica baueri]
MECVFFHFSLSLKNVLNIEVIPLEEPERGVVEKVHWYDCRDLAEDSETVTSTQELRHDVENKSVRDKEVKRSSTHEKGPQLMKAGLAFAIAQDMTAIAEHLWLDREEPSRELRTWRFAEVVKQKEISKRGEKSATP